MDDPLIGQLLLQIILIFFNAVFACAEIAVISMNDNKLDLMASSGDKRAKKLVSLTEQPAKFLSTIQVGITLAGFLGSAFAADSFANRIVAAFSHLTWLSPSLLKSISVVLVTLILSYFTLIFGELVPKRVAQRKAESLALGMAGFLTFVSRMFAPIVWLLTVSTNGVLRLLGIDPNEEEETATEEEIRMMVDAGSEKGTIDQSEKEMIQNIFEFDDISAEEVMTHRTDCDMLWEEDSDEVWRDTINNSRHSFYPICGETVDDIIGVLNVKEYFRLADQSRQNVIDKAVKAPFFVIESVKLDDLFFTMQKSKNHYAIVLDDYGGFSGVITMNDLLEQLVGNLEESGDDVIEDDPILEKIDEDTYHLNGYVYMEDLIKTINVKIDPEDCETFTSYVFSHLASVPDDGSKLDLNIGPLEIHVSEIEDHRIENATIHINRDLIQEEEED